MRYLASEFRIRSSAPGVLARLGDTGARARQDYPTSVRYEWSVKVSRGCHRLIEEDGAETVAPTTAEMVGILHNRIIARALDALPQHGSVQAVIGHYAGHGFLLVGDRGSGKTTLAIALLLDGIDISGDDLVLVSNGQAIAFPAQFYFWESTRRLIPALPPPAGPPLLLARGSEVRVPIDPLGFGREWWIRPSPISAVFCLDPNFGGVSTLRRCRMPEALPYVMPQCASPRSGDPTWIGRFCNMLDRIPLAILTVGSLDAAIRWIRIALDRLPPVEAKER